MRLFEKMNKIIKDNLLESYSDYVIDDYKSMQVKINKLKEVMTNLSKARRKDQAKERSELVEQLFRILEYIDNSLDYEYNLIDLCHLLKLHSDMQLTPKVSKQVSYAINTKNELRKDYETIYRNFKNMAKKFDDIPMKEILKCMREVFDFDNINQNESNHTKRDIYWDSTTMKFRAL